jgi:protein subunit release factor A
MKASISTKLDQLAERLDEVNALLAREDATANMDQYRKLSREHAELSPVASSTASIARPRMTWPRRRRCSTTQR